MHGTKRRKPMGNSRRITASLAVAAAVGLTGSALATTPAAAQAAGSDIFINTDRAGSYFLHNGDKVTVVDHASDGYSVEAVLEWYTGGSGWDELRVHATHKGDVDSAHWNLKEGESVKLQMCYAKDGLEVKCSAWHKGHA